MKQNKKKLPAVLFAGLSLMGMSGAQASSELASSAKITFTIDSISNLTQPGLINPLDLEILGSFEQDGSFSYAYLNGDASINDNNPSELSQIPSLPGLSFSHTFAINGSANDGSLESYHLGLYGLSLNNSGLTDTYTVDLGFSYLLSASAAGQNADTDVKIDYFSDEDVGFLGSDYAYSNIFEFPVDTKNKSGTFSITLAPGATGLYLADVVINGNLTAAPVPLPAAAWSFLAGLLGILGVKKRNNPTTQMA